MSSRSPAPPLRQPRLPLTLSAFVGRTRELQELSALLSAHRLVTLVGAAGSGKTRLAVESVRAADGEVLWVELGALTDGALVAGQVAALLGIRHQAGVDTLDILAATLGQREILVVLDNCEHVLDACALLVERLLSACPSLRVLATSRQALGIPGERAWLVPLLRLPWSGDALYEQKTGAEAVQLFAGRAADVVPGFALTPANIDAVVRICRRLDGLPLAIELAAARVTLLPPEQLVKRLDDVFAILTNSARTALPRHRTLRALLDWSYDLLEEPERLLLRRLSVFAGGFTLDAAEQVPAPDDIESCDVLDLLAALVDRSLVTMREVDGEARYSLLQTVRSYAASRLASEENEAARHALGQRHATWYRAFADVADEELHGPDQLRALRRMDAEHDNLRSALAWSIAHDDAMLALNLCRAAGTFWSLRGHHTEGRRWIGEALRLDGPSCGLAAHALTLSGTFARMHGEHDVARAQHAHAVTIARDAQDDRALADALANLGSELALHRDLEGARDALSEAVTLRRRLGVPWALSQALSARAGVALTAGDAAEARRLRLEAAEVSRSANDRAGEARAMVGLGEVARLCGEWEEAQAYNERAIELFRALGERWHMSASLQNLGWIAAARGDLRASLAAFREFFQLFLAAGNRGIGAGLCLAGVAHVLHVRGEHALAARALGTAQRAFAAVGIKPAAADLKQWDRTRDALREALGAESFESAWTHDLEGDLVQAATALLERAMSDCTAEEAEACLPDTGCDVLCAVKEPVAVAPVVQSARLRVHALGPLRVFRDDELITVEQWGSARPRELLLFLLMAPHGRTRDEVGLAFWPESTTAQVSNSFHVALYRLRKALGRSEWITLAGDRYRIASGIDVEVDVQTFENGVTKALRGSQEMNVNTLSTLLHLYRGDFLEGESVSSWADPIRERLRRLRLDALEALADHQAATGDDAAAAETFRQLIALDELHEPAYRGLMECLARTGHRAEALRLYQRLTTLLHAELGAAPSPASVAAWQRLQLLDA